MDKIKIRFLGTGSAIPSAKRNHTAILLCYKQENILVDCGEGTQRQFRKARESMARVNKLLITHWHGDHFLGIPGMMQTLALNGHNQLLQIYGPIGSRKKMDLINELIRDVNLNFNVKEVEQKTFFENDDFYLESFPLNHGIRTNGYNFVIKDKVRLDKKKLKKLGLENSPFNKKLSKGDDIVFNGKKIKSKNVGYIEKGRKVSFVFDTAYDECIVNSVKGADLLIIESSFSGNDADKAKELGHLTALEAGKIAKKAKVGKLILTHISERYERDFSMIKSDAKSVFKNIALAKDLDLITL